MIDQLIKLFPGLATGKRITKIILLGLVIYLGIIGTTGFACFILEEAAQARGFGPYMLIQGKQWQDAKLATEECLRQWRRDTIMVTLLSLPSPVGFAYRRYFEAEKVKLDAQLKRIEFELEKLNKKAAMLEESIAEKQNEKVFQNGTPLKNIDLTDNEKKVARDVTLTPGRLEQLKKMAGLYRTKFGKAYHLASCSAIQGREVIELTDEEIQSGKYAACKKCRPGN